MRSWEKLKRLPPVEQDYAVFQGGMDQVTPTLQLPPGVVKRGGNFECDVNGGYTRIAGYERFDGRPNPSAATYLVLTCTLTATVSLGDVVTGVTSSATGTVIVVDGSTVVVTKVTGTFDAGGEDIEVSSSPVGTLDSYINLDADAANDANYRHLASNEYRSDIAVVPGSGSIRGVAYLGSTVYAWRDNAGGTAMEIYKSTTGGWAKVDLGYELAFGTGSVEISEGDTVEGATSSAQGVVARVVLESGTWVGGDAAGRLILSSVTAGPFNSSENLTVSTVVSAVTTAAESAIALAPAGRVVTVKHNFGFSSARLYGADGVNQGFEFDGTVYVPIATGMVDDTPDLVAVLKNHLFFSFGHSLQFSSINNPYIWSVITGAGEIAMPEVINGLRVLPGDQTNGAMAIYTEAKTSVLYGFSSASFTLSPFLQSGGAIRYSGADLDQPYVFGDYGVTSLKATLNYGNFLTSALTMKLRPFTRARRTLVSAAVENREKGQYRLFFSDGYGLYITIINGKVIGAMPMQFNDEVRCITRGEKASSGEEISYFGSDNGYVFREGKSTSFDGEEIPASIYLVFNSIKSPRTLKEFIKAVIEVTGNGYCEFSFGYTLAYFTLDKEQPGADEQETIDLRSSYWDEFIWDNFVWDGRDVGPVEFRLEGSGENISVGLTSFSAVLKPFTFNTMILHHKFRRHMR